MAIYGYTRISSKTQIGNNSTENQVAKILEQYPTALISSEQLSGINSKRPLLRGLIERMDLGDVLVVASLDRFCRSTEEGIQLIEQIQKKGGSVHVLNLGVLDSSPIGKMITTILLSFAEFERAVLMERIREGRAIARTKDGYREGRPLKFTPKQMDFAIELTETKTLAEIQRLTGISPATLKRHKKKRQDELRRKAMER